MAFIIFLSNSLYNKNTGLQRVISPCKPFLLLAVNISFNLWGIVQFIDILYIQFPNNKKCAKYDLLCYNKLTDK